MFSGEIALKYINFFFFTVFKKTNECVHILLLHFLLFFILFILYYLLRRGL